MSIRIHVSIFISKIDLSDLHLHPNCFTRSGPLFRRWDRSNLYQAASIEMQRGIGEKTTEGELRKMVGNR
jgi:hypothetical protein